MATEEKVILDPSEVATDDRSEFDLTCWIAQEGVDWGDAQVAAYMSESRIGDYPVDFRIPNREVQIPLSLGSTRGTITPQRARAQIQAKAALFQREGGWVKRVTNAGGTVFADVVDASAHLTSTSGKASSLGIDIEDAALILRVIPDFYGAELQLADHTETTLPEITFTETSVFGDYPGRVRIVVDEDQGIAQNTLIYGFRSRHYSADVTARLAYEAEDLEPLGGGTAYPDVNASGGSEVRKQNLGTASWTTLVGTDIGGTASLTHTGRYQVYGRVNTGAPGVSDMQLRLVWGIGDATSNPTYNPAQTMGTSVYWQVIDFGAVDLRPSPIGTHSWVGNFQGLAAGTGQYLAFDRIWFVPCDDPMGVVQTHPVLNANQSAELRTEGYFRETSAGGVYAELPIYGDLPRLPSNNGTAEIFLKASRAHIGGSLAGDYIDDISARITYRPSWLFVDDT